MSGSETWFCPNPACGARVKTDTTTRTCPDCFEMRPLPLSFAESVQIYPNLQTALADCYRDLGHSLFLETTPALKKIATQTAKDSSFVPTDNPLTLLYLDKSPGGLGCLAKLGFGYDFGTISRVHTEFTVAAAKDAIAVIDAYLLTISAKEFNKLPEITAEEKLYNNYQLFQSYPETIRTNPNLSSKLIPQKPKKLCPITYAIFSTW